jgi:hypothetical protein
MLDVHELKQAVQDRDAQKIALLMKKHNLSIQGTKIIASRDNRDQITAFWDKRQLVKKINLNSLNIGRVCQ